MNADRLLLAPAALLLAAATACGHARAAEDHSAGGMTTAQRARIHVVPVVSESFRPNVEVTGTVAFDGDHSTQVLATISGPVLRILADVGTHVTAGQPLALVASPDFAADLSTYRRTEAAFLNAQRVAARDSALYANDALARQDLEQAQTDMAGAAADRDAALEALRALGVDSATLADIRSGRPAPVRQGVIRAPIAGAVVEKLLTPGQLIQAGTTPCFTIADMSTVWVMGDVFETDIGSVAVGDDAEIRPAVTDSAFHGRVTYVGALVNPDTRATSVRIVTPNPGEYLKKDMFVRVVISSRRPRTGLLVPASAVLRDQENIPFVFIASTGGAFTRRPVTLGSHLGDRYEITSGVTAADRVVAEGALFLQFAESQ